MATNVSPIKYSIAGSSEYSGRYAPEHIMVDRPHDQTSRWSSNGREREGSPTGRGWIMLQLVKPAILESITFGKHHKAHPCNMKDFEIHIGTSPDHLKKVLRGVLKNDTKPETFPLPTRTKDGVRFPTRFVKIVSVSAYTANFNTSIWHVALSGIIDEERVREVRDEFDKNRESIAMRHIMKHLRQRRHISIYRQLMSRTGVRLENGFVTELFEELVLRGNWTDAERRLHILASKGLFTSYIHSCTPCARWRRLRATDADGDAPGKRGGHAMCMDSERGIVYLFGGYDGEKSLDDFWAYDVKDERWRILSHSVVEEKNGPGPRACHKMVFDPRSGCIYMLGRLGDGDLPSQEAPTVEQPEINAIENGANPEQSQGPVQSAWRHRQSASVGGGTTTASVAEPPPAETGRPAQTFFSEFYRYRTRGLDQGKWELLNVDTTMADGPPLVYDHQLALDSDAQIVYVQGGRVVDGEWNAPKYSGFYRYDLRTGKWANIQPSLLSGSTFSPRFGHSVVFDPSDKKLFIFAGQKEEYLSDLWEYDVRTNTLNELSASVTSFCGPEACFAHRAVIDPGLKEIYVFGGLTKKQARGSGISVYLYRYDTQPGKWTKVPAADHRNSNRKSSPSSLRSQGDMEVDTNAARSTDDEEPVARCACQVVYDPKSQTFYLHGGNAGQISREAGAGPRRDERLDDFWSMLLERPSEEEVIRRASFEIRRQQYREMCEEGTPVAALAFLQNGVSAVVNHDDPEEASTFRSLLSHLLAGPPVTASDTTAAPEPVRPVESPTSTDSGSGEWTSTLQVDEDAEMGDAYSNFPDEMYRTTAAGDDPYELLLRGGKSLSDARFKQRMEVFESLLRFINKTEVQPPESLLDILDDTAIHSMD